MTNHVELFEHKIFRQQYDIRISHVYERKALFYG